MQTLCVFRTLRFPFCVCCNLLSSKLLCVRCTVWLIPPKRQALNPNILSTIYIKRTSTDYVTPEYWSFPFYTANISLIAFRHPWLQQVYCNFKPYTIKSWLTHAHQLKLGVYQLLLKEIYSLILWRIAMTMMAVLSMCWFYIKYATVLFAWLLFACIYALSVSD